MPNKKNIAAVTYMLVDFISSAIAWSAFFYFRKVYIEKYTSDSAWQEMWADQKFQLGVFLIPSSWLIFYYLIGCYKDVYRKSRLSELASTFLTSITGITILFFLTILDDAVIEYQNYYKAFFCLFFLHFFLTAIGRFILSSRINHKIHQREIGFKTVIVGSNENALRLFEEMQQLPKGTGNIFCGFVHVDQKNGYSEELKLKVPHLGEFNEIRDIILKHEIEEIIIAIESKEHDYLSKIVNDLSDIGVVIKIIPDIYDVVAGSVKMTSIFGALLIEIKREIMPNWQVSAKRLMDIFISLFVMIFLSWLYLILAIGVKLSSRGPIFYSHERIGLHGKPFRIFKFRSMYTDAEKMGPALSKENDPRITPFGLFLRKSRLDEFPQFFNVLIGEMSIVGPRPERQYFIDQIMVQAPHYKHLHKVRPGITSWGQVKYGYAENVDQMIQRLKYDIIYIENMSLLVDFKIIIYTILIVFQGRGK